MKSIKRACLVLVKLLLLVGVIYLLFALVSFVLNGALDDPRLRSKLLPAIQCFCFITAVMLLKALFDRKSGWRLGFRQAAGWKHWLSGALWGIGMMTSVFMMIWLLGGLEIVSISCSQLPLGSALYWIVLFICVSVNEELFCRGYLQGLIGHAFGKAAGILIPALLFASLHLLNDHVLDNPVPVINLFLAGLLFGLLRQISGGLWLPMGIHFTWNLFQGNVFGFLVSGIRTSDSIMHIKVGDNPLVSGGGFGAEGSIVTSAVLIVYTTILVTRLRKTAASKAAKYSV